ncbi:hypothetical protein ACQK5W_07305 [Pantoea sp. FN060301]|uniref:hypothetical protein n=1 Tax=Pantoea sp. FN060301 TaxID=3420380 RepID=UPI003D17D7F0
MDAREDKLLALIGLLSAGLITIVVLFTLIWFSDVRSGAENPVDPQSCFSKKPHAT